MPPIRKTSNHAPVLRPKTEEQPLPVKKKAGRTIRNSGERFHLLKSLWLSIVNFFTCLKSRMIQKTEPTVSIQMDVLNNDTQRHLSKVINALATGDCKQFLASTSEARIALQQQTGGNYDLHTYMGEITKLCVTIKNDQHNYAALVKQLNNPSSNLYKMCGVMEYITGDVQNWSGEEGILISLAYATTSVLVEESLGPEQAQALSKLWGMSIIDQNLYQELLSQIPWHAA